MSPTHSKKTQAISLQDRLFTYLMVCLNGDAPASETLYFKLVRKMGDRVSSQDSVALFTLATEKLDKLLNDPKSSYAPQKELPMKSKAGRKVEQDKIHTVLAGLKPTDRILITLKYLMDFSYFDIAAITKRKEGALRTSLSRSVQRFIKVYRSTLNSKSTRVTATSVKRLLNKFTSYSAPIHKSDEKKEDKKVSKAQSSMSLSAKNRSSLPKKLMKLFKQYTWSLVAFVVVLLAVFYFNQNSYTYHLKKVDYSLEKIEALEETDSVPSRATKADLIETSLSDLASSIEAAERLHEPKVLLTALKAIADRQEKVNMALADGLWDEETKPYLEDLLISLENLLEQQKLIKQAMLFIGKEIREGETDVNIDIETELD